MQSISGVHPALFSVDEAVEAPGGVLLRGRDGDAWRWAPCRRSGSLSPPRAGSARCSEGCGSSCSACGAAPRPWRASLRSSPRLLRASAAVKYLAHDAHAHGIGGLARGACARKAPMAARCASSMSRSFTAGAHWRASARPQAASNEPALCLEPSVGQVEVAQRNPGARSSWPPPATSRTPWGTVRCWGSRFFLHFLGPADIRGLPDAAWRSSA